MLDVTPMRMLDDDAELNGLKAGDGQQIVRFYARSVEDPVKSKEAGRPIHEQVPYMELRHPGDKLFVLNRPAVLSDIQRFPKQWERFRMGQTDLDSGTPLSLMFPGHPEVVDNLRALGLHTVEHLAAVGDGEVGNIGPGGRKWRDAAKRMIDSSEANAETVKLREENRIMAERVAAMEQQMKDFTAALAAAPKEDAPAARQQRRA